MVKTPEPLPEFVHIKKKSPGGALPPDGPPPSAHEIAWRAAYAEFLPEFEAYCKAVLGGEDDVGPEEVERTFDNVMDVYVSDSMESMQHYLILRNFGRILGRVLFSEYAGQDECISILRALRPIARKIMSVGLDDDKRLDKMDDAVWACIKKFHDLEDGVLDDRGETAD